MATFSQGKRGMRPLRPAVKPGWYALPFAKFAPEPYGGGQPEGRLPPQFSDRSLKSKHSHRLSMNQ
jgi:hypothetical protein